MDYFANALKKYADLSGRETRKSYWMFILFYIAAVLVDLVLGTFFITAIFVLALLVPNIAIVARRLHDTSRSGWWMLTSIIPLIGSIILLVFLVQDSHNENKFGSNPKVS